VPQLGDACGAGGDLAGVGVLVAVDETQVERRQSAVVADLEHVVDLGGTARERTASARSPSSVINAASSGLDGTTTVSARPPARSGTRSDGRSEASSRSQNVRNPMSSSGTLSNAAMRVCSRNRPPSGASSMRVTGRANVPAHESNASSPASTSRS